nr:hypothetical protein [Tanacetum cinerariifolium]
KRLLYDNSSPRLPEEFVSDNSNADIESFSLSPVPIKDSDSHMEEIDLSLNPDDQMPSGIEDKDVVEDISPTKEPQVLPTLPTHPTLQLNVKFQSSSESLFAYVVWIFLPFLVTILSWMFFCSIFIPLINSSMGGIWSSSFDLKQALRGRHPMLIF